ncbi:MAG: uroporphyrinogen decarboxylase family protein [Victivallaceae bacterium]|nr:uroporphyrinogen decarboxylase family protein [Victivallaceae bacterium]
MNDRQRFLDIMRFRRFNDAYLSQAIYQNFWEDTIKRWHKEGLPEDIHIDEYFKFSRMNGEPIIDTFRPLPPFEQVIIEEKEDYRIVSDEAGIRKKELKNDTSMPQYLEFPVKNRQDFEKMKKRYNPQSPSRYPQFWEDYKKSVENRNYPLGSMIGGFFGWAREWIGVEELSVMFYDDPGLLHEIFEFLGDFFIEANRKLVEEVKLDYVWFWEDMAYKTAPLISPKHFREFLLPQYKKVTSFLKKHNIDIILVDSDGNINELIPLWLEGGVNGVYPLEAAAGMDAVALRKKYGKELLLMGNIDKRALSRGREIIKKEVMNKVPYLLATGGYIPAVDHAVPPDIPFADFVYYLELIRNITGDENNLF